MTRSSLTWHTAAATVGVPVEGAVEVAVADVGVADALGLTEEVVGALDGTATDVDALGGGEPGGAAGGVEAPEQPTTSTDAPSAAVISGRTVAMLRKSPIPLCGNQVGGNESPLTQPQLPIVVIKVAGIGAREVDRGSTTPEPCSARSSASHSRRRSRRGCGCAAGRRIR